MKYNNLMASSRSKIPLRVTEPKKLSKIPLRVTEPKKFPSSQQKLDRNQPTIKEKYKPVKEKQSTLGSFEKKVTEINIPNDNPLKTRIKEKQIKNSKQQSQVLKDRNQPTTKEKCKPVQFKEKEKAFEKKIPEINIQEDDPFKTRAEEKRTTKHKHPSQHKYQATTKEKYKPVQWKEREKAFKKKIPEVNIQEDDPFKTKVEEKSTNNSKHPSQQNIEFVADDRMKKFILSNRELTPNILKSCSNIKRSSVMERPSLYKFPVDPYKQALEDIANLKRTSGGLRASEMQQNMIYSSPLQNRGSLYKRATFVVDPYQEAMKSIANLRIQRKIKSTKKKVTFNLCGEDRSSDSENKDENSGPKAVETIQNKIRKPSAFISDKSSESRTLPSPEFKENMLSTVEINSSKKVTFDLSSKTDQVLEDRQISDMRLPHTEKVKKEKNDFYINKISPPISPETAVNNEKLFQNFTPALHQKQQSDKNAVILNSEMRNSILKKTSNPFLNSLRNSEFREGLFSNQATHFEDKGNPKIFTPRPVSFYPHTKFSESISPEFLSNGTTDILSCAPINTPMVLKSLGRHELSPVCKKLEFKDSPKEAKKESGDSRENSQTFYLQNIMTQQKILDQLAHQECSIFMHEATFPCEIRGNLQNPIAKILNNGDEMHFVPLSMRRLS